MDTVRNTKTEHIFLLESIRAGIPSRIMMEKLPDLRKDFTQEIESDLNDLSSGCSPRGRFIWGEYGQGKTHYLKMIEQHALKQGFAVTYYTLNRDLGLNNLKLLFPVLSGQTLLGKNKIPGIMNQLAEEPLPPNFFNDISEAETKISHPLPTYFLHAFLNFLDADEMHILYNSIMGNSAYWTHSKTICRKLMRNKMRNMPKFTMREYSHSFFEFFPFLLRSLGFKGWVILLDEIELIGKLGKVGRLKSYINLSYLLNWNKQHKLPIYTLAASAKTLQTDVFFSRKNDVTKMPVAAEERFDSKTAKLITSFFDLSVKSKINLHLTPVDRSEFRVLFRVLFHIHQKAISWVCPADESLIDDIEKIVRPEQKPIRMSIRMFIEILDIYASQGRLISSVKEEKLSEHDLGDDNNEEEIENKQSKIGFYEKTLDEMFDEV